MRALITGSGLLSLIFILVVTHGFLIENNARNEELIRAVDSSLNYSFDKLNEKYETINVHGLSFSQKKDLEEEIKLAFCNCLSKEISSDANYEINFKEINLEKGYLDVEVVMSFKHSLKGREYCYYEKFMGLH